MENCIKTGAIVELVDYGIFCVADLFAVGDSRVVRFPGNPVQNGEFGEKPVWAKNRDHYKLFLNRNHNFWRKDLGVAVVYMSDLVRVEEDASKKTD